MTTGAFTRCAQRHLTGFTAAAAAALLLLCLFSPAVLGEEGANGRYRCSDDDHKILDIVPDGKCGDGAGEVCALDQETQFIGADDASDGREKREAQHKNECGLDPWTELQAYDKNCGNDGEDEIHQRVEGALEIVEVHPDACR